LPASSRSSRALAAVAAVAVVGATAAAAWATAPGRNGKIAFRRHVPRDYAFAVFTANPDGSAARRITHPARLVKDLEPDWSPDGRRIVFQRSDPNGCGPRCETDEIFVVDGDGSGLRRLAYDEPGKGCWNGRGGAGGVCRGVPAWSPDGGRIAFQCEVLRTGDDPGFGRICVMGADGSSVRELPQTPATGVVDGGPQWSPDGRRIAFHRFVHGEGGAARVAVFVMNADGSGGRRLTPWALRGAQADWSPDGRRILFTSNHDGGGNVSANLYTVRPDGTGLRRLTHAHGGNVQHLSASFSPDGKWITFGRRPGTGGRGQPDVFVMRADGTRARNVTRSSVWDSGVDWGPRR
jgi:Tol biopolymer transport system component